MRVELDENVPRSVGSLLTAAGHDVDTVTNGGLTGAPDDVVLRIAADDGRLLVTLDRGLADIRPYPPGSHAGVLLLRLSDQSAITVRELSSSHSSPATTSTRSPAPRVARRGLLGFVALTRRTVALRVAR